MIHSPLDDYIPFVEYFIVPYLLWFGFVHCIIRCRFNASLRQMAMQRVLLYGLIYMPWFVYLERRTDVHYFVIHSPTSVTECCFKNTVDRIISTAST